MLTTAGIAVLDALSSGREATPDGLATETGYSQAHIYELLDEFVTEGLVTETRGANNQRRVRVAEHPVVESYRRLCSTLNHVEWPELISPAILRVCWYLDEPRRVTDLAERLGITRQGIHAALSPLKHRAMLSSGPEYALREELSPLVAFARAVVVHDHRFRVRKIAPSATVAWCDPKRALIRVHTPNETAALQSATEWQLTGVARFQEYGLQFFLSGEPAFWYGPTEELSPAAVICHTLVLGSDSRRVGYSMLVIEKLGIDRPALEATAAWYDLVSEITEMCRLLQRGFDNPTDIALAHPSEPEYTALKQQYGVV